MSNKTITLPIYGIVITLTDCNYHALKPDSWGGGSISSSLHEPCPACSRINCYAHCDESEETEDEWYERATFNRMIDVVESFILAQAKEGVDVSSSACIKALETTIDAIGNNT